MQTVHLFYEDDYNETKSVALNDKSILEYIAKHSFTPDSRFLLKTESFVLSCAYANNKMLSLSNSRTRILPHQVESTYTIVNSLHKRFLIADEVGLGKTIEAGLVIKELSYRYNYDRVCIVCPASLQYQWQHEMQSKFNEEFTIVDKKIYHKHRGNPWQLNKIICSIDFIKNKKFVDSLSQVQWDTVVIDEAHRLRRDALTQTKSYQVAEILAKNSKALLLLSATPFRGKLEELYYLISLLDKNLLGSLHSFQQTYCVPDANLAPLKQKISSVVIRRTKRDVGGFTRRLAKTIRFELYPEERILYDATTEYVADQFNKAMQADNRAIGFVMTVFQKLLDSSSYALMCALKKRHEYLTELKEKKALPALMWHEMDDDAIEDVDDIVAVESEELENEIATLEKLVAMAINVGRNKKAEKLLQLVKKLKAEKHEKILIFTQFRTTQEYLAQVLKNFKVVLFHGSLSRDEKEAAIESFKNDAEILICTEAGGEGRNLQFCNVLINYDLPWSPLKVEQRIGRIHRFGQSNNVIIYNFATRDTVAERVLEVLNHKLKLFEESLGTPDVILGDIADERFFNRIFMELIAGLKNKRKVSKDIDTHLQKARESYSKLQELTVARKIDMNFDQYYTITMQEREFTNARIEQFMNELKSVDTSIAQCISDPNPKTGLYFVRHNPAHGTPINKFGTFKSQIALENEALEFLAFGHPLVDFGIARCKEHAFGGFSGIKQIICPYDARGLIFHYLLTLYAKEEVQQIVPVFLPEDILNQAIVEDIEQEALRQYGCVVSVENDVAKNYCDRIEYYYELSLARLEKKVRAIVTEIKESMNLHIDPYLESLQHHYRQEMDFLEKRLEWQECQRKWYGKDMHSAMTRTKNMMKKIEEEFKIRLEQYSGFADVQWNYRLINVGILICKKSSF
ncbi:MAG: SNF2-related protein [Spirochaetes bacterium]|nr:SNF2-related protein [Spirochaetota bacterium]